MGHVRTYVLGDVTARYQRLLGRSVLYATEWDAFGLPNELAALQAGTSPPEYTRHWIRAMEGQLRRLGISYDWSRVHSTADPSYYRWTQWLFVELFERGLVKRRNAILAWCPRCATTLSRMQSADGACWRCCGGVERRRFRQWFVLTSRYARRLDAGLDHLEQWSATSKRLLRAFLRSEAGADGRACGGKDWLVSRQRAWGTPIPIVHCEACGPVAVPRSLLPVRLPEDLDWSLGSAALASHPSFAATVCPRCTRSARRETETLDCFFDDIWCFLSSCLSPHATEFDPGAPDLRAWMPVDRFHSGLDTFHYLHATRSPRRRRSARRRSLGCGAPAPDRLEQRARGASGGVPRHRAPSQHAMDLRVARRRRDRERRAPVGRFIEEYRPNAGVEEMARVAERLDAFLGRRVSTGRLRSADAAVLGGALLAYAIALSPFAPHLAEEIGRLHKTGSLICRRRWPHPAAVAAAP